MRVAALDLGSNTSLLLVADIDKGRLVRQIHDETTITRLGQGVHAARAFHPEALARMRECLSKYQRTIKSLNCERIVAVATSAARDVSNGAELVKIGHEFGIPIHIISGDREAQLTFRGALCDRSETEKIAVIDVGGGSTEIIQSVNGKIEGTSVDVGSVRLSEMFVKSDPVTASELSQLRQYATEAFRKAAIPAGPFNEVVAVAGTPTTLAGIEQQVEFSEERIHGYKMSLESIDSWLTRLVHMPLSERAALKGMQPKRADVIVAGTAILATAIQNLRQNRITVSTRGVRFGVALTWQDF